MHTPASLQRGIELVDGAGDLTSVLTETSSVGPGFEYVSPRDIVATLQRAGEAVLVEYVAYSWRVEHPERHEALRVAFPRGDGGGSVPRELLAAIAVVPRPERAVPLVETDHSLHTFEGTPRRPRRALGEFVAQRRAIERIGGRGVRVEGARIEHGALPFGSGTDEDVIVEMGFAVAVQAVSETDHAAPSCRRLIVTPATTVAHHERSIL